MKRAALVLLVVPFIALLLVACDGESPSAPEPTPEAAPSFGKTIPPDQQTECYKAGMAALEASDVYGEATKDLAKCDQTASGPCDSEQQAHSGAWAALMATYDNAVLYCGGGTEPPSNNLPPEIVSVDIAPSLVYPSTTELVCEANYADPEGQPVTASYRWYKDGNLTVGVDRVYPGPFVEHEAFSCEVTVSDGQAETTRRSAEVWVDQPLCSPHSVECQACDLGGEECRTCDTDGTWGPWSGCPEFNPLDYLLVTEILQNPQTGDGNGEFVEVYNSAPFPIDVSGLELYGTGIYGVELAGSIPAGGYCVYSDLATVPGTCAVYSELDIYDQAQFVHVGLSSAAGAGHALTFTREDNIGIAYPDFSLGLRWLDIGADACDQSPTPGEANSECIY